MAVVKLNQLFNRKTILPILIVSFLAAWILFKIRHPDAFQRSQIDQTELLNPNQTKIIKFLIRNEADSLAQGNHALVSYSNINVMEASANTLSKTYSANEVDGDNKFKSKDIFTIGKVANINKDIYGNNIIVLSANGSFLGVQAYMNGNEAPWVAGLRKNSSIALVCKGSGYVVGSPILKDCQSALQALDRRIEHYVSDVLDKKEAPTKGVLSMLAYGMAVGDLLDTASPCFTEGSDRLCEEDMQKTIKTKTVNFNEGMKNSFIKLKHYELANDSMIETIQKSIKN